MHLPRKGDYIDIHVHNGTPLPGVFIVESLMAHEDRLPADIPGAAYTYGIHPWFLTEGNRKTHLDAVEKTAPDPFVIAIGEAGFDRLKGPSTELQKEVFEMQAEISESYRKPLIIHCVRAWDEFLSAKKSLRPRMPWLIHGFRGKIRLAEQLISKGFYLSIWFEYALREESSALIKALPADKIFLETDGADVDIRDIYSKVANDRKISVEELKDVTMSNFNEFFAIDRHE
jgi:TatD DNase family protein